MSSLPTFDNERKQQRHTPKRGAQNKRMPGPLPGTRGLIDSDVTTGSPFSDRPRDGSPATHMASSPTPEAYVSKYGRTSLLGILLASGPSFKTARGPNGDKRGFRVARAGYVPGPEAEPHPEPAEPALPAAQMPPMQPLAGFQSYGPQLYQQQLPYPRQQQQRKAAPQSSSLPSPSPPLHAFTLASGIPRPQGSSERQQSGRRGERASPAAPAAAPPPQMFFHQQLPVAAVAASPPPSTQRSLHVFNPAAVVFTPGQSYAPVLPAPPPLLSAVALGAPLPVLASQSVGGGPQGASRPSGGGRGPPVGRKAARHTKDGADDRRPSQAGESSAGEGGSAADGQSTQPYVPPPGGAAPGPQPEAPASSGRGGSGRGGGGRGGRAGHNGKGSLGGVFGSPGTAGGMGAFEATLSAAQAAISWRRPTAEQQPLGVAA